MSDIIIFCRVHECSSESFIAPCYYSLWAGALDRCELREMELRPLPQVEGQEVLGLNEQGMW